MESDISAMVVNDGDDTVIFLVGEIDLVTASRLWSCVQRSMAAGARRVVLDLAETRFIDSTGLNVLIRSSVHYGADALVLRRVPPRIMKVFEITGLTRSLNIMAGEGARPSPPFD